MAREDHRNLNHNEDDDESGGASSGIQFKDFLSNAESVRDDLLSPDEMRRLILVHADIHQANVKKQKELKAFRQEVKEGKISVETYRQGLQGQGAQGQKYKSNPRLNKAQFSGIDSKINPLPNNNAAETNQEMQQELVYRNELKYRRDHTPVLNSTPQLKR